MKPQYSPNLCEDMSVKFREKCKWIFFRKNALQCMSLQIFFPPIKSLYKNGDPPQEFYDKLHNSNFLYQKIYSLARVWSEIRLRNYQKLWCKKILVIHEMIKYNVIKVPVFYCLMKKIQITKFLLRFCLGVKIQTSLRNEKL